MGTAFPRVSGQPGTRGSAHAAGTAPRGAPGPGGGLCHVRSPGGAEGSQGALSMAWAGCGRMLRFR